MNVWRLIPHHEDPAQFAEWSRSEKTLAIGWGGMGDLNNHDFCSENELKQIVTAAHPTFSTNSVVNGGRSLWRFHNKMTIGDLVIISASGSRKLTMKVTGDYYFVSTGDDPKHYYEHRRKAEAVQIDPNLLWQAANRVAAGEGIYSTLVRCDRQLTEEQADTLAG